MKAKKLSWFVKGPARSKLVPETPFDRKTFNSHDPNQMFWLRRLRLRGFSRACELRRRREMNFIDQEDWVNKYVGVRSTSFEDAHFLDTKDGVFLDAGCGNSVDANVALDTGYSRAYKLDLWIDEYYKDTDNLRYLRTDMCEHIPLNTSSVDMIVCQAVLPLMSERDRKKFYKEAHRLLKKGKVLAVYFCKLKREHPWNLAKERENILRAGFKVYNQYSNSMVFIKT